MSRPVLILLIDGLRKGKVIPLNLPTFLGQFLIVGLNIMFPGKSNISANASQQFPPILAEYGDCKFRILDFQVLRVTRLFRVVGQPSRRQHERLVELDRRFVKQHLPNFNGSEKVFIQSSFYGMNLADIPAIF